jgi:hypothetical protein
MLRIEINMICFKKNCWLRLVNYQKVGTWTDVMTVAYDCLSCQRRHRNNCTWWGVMSACKESDIPIHGTLTYIPCFVLFEHFIFPDNHWINLLKNCWVGVKHLALTDSQSQNTNKNQRLINIDFISSQYQFHSLRFDPSVARIYNLPHSRRAR